MTSTHTIKIINEKHGILLEETFINPIQFKLFLRLVHSCVEMKQDLTFFNGSDFFIHLPYKQLVESLITTKVDTYTMTDHIINKSKLEAEKTR